MAVRNGKKIKFKFKWTKELVFLLIGLGAMIVATVLLALPSDAEKIYDKYTEAGASLESEHVFKSISYKKLTKKISSQVGSEGTFFVFYGATSCTNCVSEIQTINAAANKFEIEEVFYLDATFIDGVEDKEDAGFLAEVDTKEVALGGVDLLSYPALWVYKNGELVFTSDSWKASDSSTTIEGTWKLLAEKTFYEYK